MGGVSLSTCILSQLRRFSHSGCRFLPEATQQQCAELSLGWEQEEAAAAEHKVHAEQLREQIAAHEVERKRLASIKLAEGAELRQKQAREKAIVEVGFCLEWPLFTSCLPAAALSWAALARDIRSTSGTICEACWYALIGRRGVTSDLKLLCCAGSQAAQAC